MSRSLVQSIRQFGPITETEDKEWIIDLNDKENNTDEEMNGLVNSARINTENWVCIVEPCDLRQEIVTDNQALYERIKTLLDSCNDLLPF